MITKGRVLTYLSSFSAEAGILVVVYISIEIICLIEGLVTSYLFFLDDFQAVILVNL